MKASTNWAAACRSSILGFKRHTWSNSTYNMHTAARLPGRALLGWKHASSEPGTSTLLDVCA
jgi:hypothetical protein